MRRLLDLNQPGAVFVKLIGFFVLLLPGALYGVAWLAGEGSAMRRLLWQLIRMSLVAGALLLVVLVVLVVVEQVQDHLFDAHYRRQRSQKVALADGYYECQYCGNRRVRGSDQTCAVCGKRLGDGESRTENRII